MTLVATVPSLTAVARHEASIVVTRLGGETAVVRQLNSTTAFVVRGVPGPPGNSAGGALLAVNRLGEFDDETKKTAARANLGLQVIDGGTFN